MTPRRLLLLAALSVTAILPGLLSGSRPASAQQAYLQPPTQMDAAGRCTYFSRLVRFTSQSKSVCDEGRQVKTGPLTTQILHQCLADQGSGFDKTSIDGMTDAFARQVQDEGMGNACREVKAQAWDLVAQ